MNDFEMFLTFSTLENTIQMSYDKIQLPLTNQYTVHQQLTH